PHHRWAHRSFFDSDTRDVSSTWWLFLLTASAPGHNQRDVVTLFLGAEPAYFIQDCRDQVVWSQAAMCVQRLDQSFLAKLLAAVVERLCDPVRVDREKVSREESAFARQALPVGEEAQHRRGRSAVVDAAVGSKEKARQVAAVPVAQASGSVVEFRIEERRIRVIGRIFVKQPVHRLKKS